MFLFDLFFPVGFLALKEIRLLLWGFLFFWYDYVFVIGEKGFFLVLRPLVLNFPAIATTIPTLVADEW